MAKKEIDAEEIYYAIVQYQTKINKQNAICEANNAKIDRLDTVKNVIKTQKDNVYQYRSDFYSVFTDLKDETKWVGCVMDDIYNCANLEVWNDYGTYYDNIDIVLDAIYDKITELENDNCERSLIIGGFVSKINSLWNSLEKDWN